VTWSRLAARLIPALALSVCIAASALADPPRQKGKKPPVPLRVMVTRLSNDGSGIDPQARELESKLSNQGIRYDSAEVLEKKRLKLKLNEVGEIELPNGRKARVSPLHRNADGVLMAVDVDGSSKADVRARPNHTVIFSAGPYEDGKLVLSVEPEEAE
jgi:hypothetical protein